MSDLVAEKDRWKALQYEQQQQALIDQMPEVQLLAIHQQLTHPDTASHPVIFHEIDPATTMAILKEGNGMKLFISPTGEAIPTFFQ